MQPNKSFLNNALSRRTFLAGAGTAAVATLAGCSNDSATKVITPPTAGTPPTYTDVDILNFALNLEYLEAEFYLRAATGSGIPAADAGSGAGTVTGGTQVMGLTAQQQEYVNAIAQDEYNHVKFLRSALGSSAVSRPDIDLSGAFAALGSLATNGAVTAFSPFDSFNDFLIGGFTFEDVGVTAYHGGAGALSAGSPYLTPAAQILGVEAYHAATLRTLIVGTSLPTAAVPAGDPTYVNLAIAVAQVRASLSEASTFSAGAETILSSGVTGTFSAPVVGPSQIVNCDSNSIAFARTFDQVLHIVYASPTGSTGFGFGLTKGGFFPSGLNGNITETYS